MTPAAIAALVARHAAPLLLLRPNPAEGGQIPFGALAWGEFPWDQALEGYQVAAVAGHVMQAQVNDLPGGNPQVGRRITIAAAALSRAGWAGPPRKGDVVQLGGRQYVVQGCDTRATAAGEALHVLSVAG